MNRAGKTYFGISIVIVALVTVIWTSELGSKSGFSMFSSLPSRGLASSGRPVAHPKPGHETDRLEVCRRLAIRLHDELPALIVPRTVEAEAPRWLRTQRQDGSWPDISLNDPSPANWSTFEQLRRAVLLASNSHLEEATRALNFWLTRDLQSTNWWWNRLAVPKAIGQTILLLDSNGRPLAASQRNRAITIMDRGGTELTGQNRVWQAETRLLLGCVTHQVPQLSQAFSMVESELSTDVDEGIQPDFSFHQHGPLIYNGGYGAPFVTDELGSWYRV